MDEDPEALVERRLLRDPEHARELVLQRARPVGVDVSPRSAAAPRRGGAGTAPATAPCAGRRPARAGARRARRRAGTRRARDVSKISRCSAVTACSSRALTSGSASATDCPSRVRSSSALSLSSSRWRTTAWETSRSVSKRSSPSRPPTCAIVVHQLVAQHPERGLQRLRGPEELLVALLPLAARRRARLLGERRRVLDGAAVGALRVGEHEPLARARHRDVQQAALLGDVLRPWSPAAAPP